MQKLSHNKRPHPIKKLSEKEIKKKEEHAKAVARALAVRQQARQVKVLGKQSTQKK